VRTDGEVVTRMKRPRRLLEVILLATLGLAAVACSDGEGSRASSAVDGSRRTVPAAQSLGHTTWNETFVDRSRQAIPKSGTSLPYRTLVTTIYRPKGTGPFPLIVFSHGSAGHPDKFTELFSAWADAGFVVAAPAFPLTNDHVDGASANIGDVTNQPADVSFVLDALLALDNQRGSPLFGVVDERRIGAGGLSLGGITTYTLVYGNPGDRRITAVEVLDGLRPSNLALDGHVPLLIAHSDTDPTIGYSSAREAFDAARPPAWLVTLHGASHGSQWEDAVTPYDDIANRTTLDFWEATLRRETDAFARLERDASIPGRSSIEAKVATPRTGG
jgi:dienelactone hydrolase